jgi:hypothetical protein
MLSAIGLKGTIMAQMPSRKENSNMRWLLIVAVTLVAGCRSDIMRKSEDAAWVKKVEAKLSLMEENYLKWEASRRSERIPSSKYSWGVKHCIRDLWILSGHCLFGDIPCDSVVYNAPKISKKYEKFIREYAKTPREEILLKSVEANIELIPTEYCVPALTIIQQRVSFENTIYLGAGYPQCIPIQSDKRAKAHKAMRQWFEGNKKRLVWNASFGEFCRDSAWSLMSFTLPAEVIEAMESPI